MEILPHVFMSGLAFNTQISGIFQVQTFFSVKG